MKNAKKNMVNIAKQTPAVAIMEPPTAFAVTNKRINWMLISSLVALGMLSIFAHFKIASLGEDYTGVLAPLDRIFDAMLILVLVGISFCVGRKVCTLSALSFTGFAEELVFSIMLGVGAIGLLIFGLGVLGLFKAVPVVLLLGALLAFTRQEAFQLYESTAKAWKRGMAKEHRTVTILFLALLILLAIRAAEPPHAVDEAIYHLAAPKDFVQAGRLLPLYDNFSGNMPLLTHMFYVVCLIAKADIVARLFSLSLAVVTAVALYAFCRRYLNRTTGVMALFGFFGAGMVMEVSVTARIDVTLAGFIFVATYAMMNYFETENRGWLVVSALLAGTSMGVKYTAGIWIALLGVMYIYENVMRKALPVTALIKDGVLYVAIALAVISPWLIKNYVYFKNPVYPFLTGEVAAHDRSGIRFFNSDDERQMEAYFEQAQKEIPQIVNSINQEMAQKESQRFEHHPFRFWEFFTMSEKYNMGLAEAHHDPNYLFLLAPLVFLFTRHRWLVWLGIISMAFFCFVAATSWIARYYLPIYPALTVLAASALTMISEKLQRHSAIAKYLPTLATATALALTAFVFAVQIYVSGGMSFLSGSLSRREFLKGAFYYPAVDYLNHNTPAEAKVMMMGAQMGYHLQRDYLAEAGWDSIEWQRLMIRNNSIEDIHEDIKRQGITHILYEPGLFGFVALIGRAGSGPSGAMYNSATASRTGKDYQVQLRNWATFELYRSKYLETIQTIKMPASQYQILKVK